MAIRSTSKKKYNYDAIFSRAIKAVVEQIRQDKKDMGFDLRFVIRRNPRKKTVTIEPDPHNTELIHPQDFDCHLVILANTLGLQGKRVTRVVPGAETAMSDSFKVVVHWEWARQKRRR